MSDIKITTSVYHEPEKMRVKNTKTHAVTRNEKVWAIGSIIEVDESEAFRLHEEGYKVMQEGEDEAEKPEQEKAPLPEEKKNVSEEGNL
jgi:hypothetical protein